ncbi:MAG: DUF4270 family protein [Bacteroidota bacterium]
MKFSFPLPFTYIILGSLLGLSLLVGSCTDPITVGSELLEDDRASIGFNGSLDLDTRTLTEDSLRVFAATGNLRVTRSLFGSIEDPFFGRSKRSLYMIPDLPRSVTTGVIVPPPFAGGAADSVEIDSVVIVLPLDTSLFYGGVEAYPFPYQVNQIMDFVDVDLDVYTTQEWMLEPMPIGSGQIRPQKDPIFLHDTAKFDSILFSHVRITLDPVVADRFMAADSMIYASDSVFRDFFPGLFIQPTGLTNSGLPINTEITGAIGIFFYTSVNNRNPDFYRVPLEFATPQVLFDRTGSIAADQLQQTINNEQVLLQGGAGLTVEVEVTNLDEFADKVINNAELEIFLQEVDNYRYGDYPAVQEIALYYRNSEGVLQEIGDATSLIPGSGNDTRNFFLGGVLETDEATNQQVYRSNLSVHLQDMVSGDVPPQFYVRVRPLDQEIGRSILFGPDAAEFPMKLKVAFTEF